MDGVIDSQTEHQGRHSHFEGCHPRGDQVDEPERPDEGGAQTHHGEEDPSRTSERDREEDHDHCTSKRDEEPEVGEGRRIDVVGQQVDREGFE